MQVPVAVGGDARLMLGRLATAPRRSACVTVTLEFQVGPVEVDLHAHWYGSCSRVNMIIDPVPG